jgi:hypothetical protein
MNTYPLLLVSLFLLLFASCSKVENNKKKNILTGKIKTLVDYNNDTLSKKKYYSFMYDSTTGLLTKVSLLDTSAIETSRKEFLFTYNTNDIFISVNNQNIKKKYKIHFSGNLITTFELVDTATNNTIQSIFIDANRDSIINAIDYGINYASRFKDFQYTSNNCLKIKNTYWDFTNILSPYKKTIDFTCTFNALSNTNMLYKQSIFSSVDYNVGLLSYFLGIDGYYLVQPNSNLINTLSYTDINNYNIKYNYFYTSDLVTIVEISYFPTILKEYQEMTYY